MKRNLLLACTGLFAFGWVFFGETSAQETAKTSAQQQSKAAEKTEARELLQETRAELESDYRKALEQYDQLKTLFETVIVNSDPDEPRTLLQVQLVELDKQLTLLKTELFKRRAAQRWIELATKQGLEHAEVIAWILKQEAAVIDEGNLPAVELLRRYKVKIDRDVELADLEYNSTREEFIRYYQKAVRLEQIQNQLRLKEEEIANLRKQLDATLRDPATQTIDQRLDSIESRLKSLEEKIDKLLNRSR